MGQKEGAEKAGARPQVLLVEDSPIAQEKIRKILGYLGCEVAVAGDGVEGLTWVKGASEAPILIVLDIQMPRMDGITTLRYLRQIPALANTRVVMLTTQSDKETVRTALSHGADDFIRKDSSIPAIGKRLQANLKSDGARPSGPSTRSPEAMAKVAKGIYDRRRPIDAEEKAPWVLLYESPGDLQDMLAGKTPHLVQFYESLAQSIDRFRSTYPGLTAGYGIESKRQVVTRVTTREKGPVSCLMVSGRHSDGIALARMAQVSQGHSVPVYLVCDSAESLGSDAVSGLSRAGVRLRERGKLRGEDLDTLLREHMLPEFEETESGLQFFRLAPGMGSAAAPGDQVAVHVAGALQDGTVCVDTRADDEPWQFVVGDGTALPAVDEAVRRLAPRGKALIVAKPDLAYGAEGDGNLIPPDATVAYNLEVVERTAAPAEDEEAEPS